MELIDSNHLDASFGNGIIYACDDNKLIGSCCSKISIRIRLLVLIIRFLYNDKKNVYNKLKFRNFFNFRRITPKEFKDKKKKKKSCTKDEEVFQKERIVIF